MGSTLVNVHVFYGVCFDETEIEHIALAGSKQGCDHKFDSSYNYCPECGSPRRVDASESYNDVVARLGDDAYSKHIDVIDMWDDSGGFVGIGVMHTKGQDVIDLTFCHTCPHVTDAMHIVIRDEVKPFLDKHGLPWNPTSFGWQVITQVP